MPNNSEKVFNDIRKDMAKKLGNVVNMIADDMTMLVRMELKSRDRNATGTFSDQEFSIIEVKQPDGLLYDIDMRPVTLNEKIEADNDWHVAGRDEWSNIRHEDIERWANARGITEDDDIRAIYNSILVNGTRDSASIKRTEGMYAGVFENIKSNAEIHIRDEFND